jgi:hypothetical protein
MFAPAIDSYLGLRNQLLLSLNQGIPLIWKLN